MSASPDVRDNLSASSSDELTHLYRAAPFTFPLCLLSCAGDEGKQAALCLRRDRAE